MKCPFCRDLENKVIDSRLAQEGDVIRRRRECLECRRRFTTYERAEDSLPMVVKKDGRREPFDRMKIVAGLKRACEKRPVSMEQIEVDRRPDRARRCRSAASGSSPSSVVGEAVMRELHGLDTVAYVRFASVYRSFQDIGEFMEELEQLIKERRGGRGGERRGDARPRKPRGR